jgi:hypothetical protein
MIDTVDIVEDPVKLAALFTEHPASVGETYGEHFRTATSFSAAMVVGGVACLLHALLPFLCVTTASRTIARLHERMVVDRKRNASRTGGESDNVHPASHQPPASTQRRTAS